MIFRHDLDEINRTEFDRLKEVLRSLNVSSTLFVLPHQFSREFPVFFPKGTLEEERLLKRIIT